MNENEIDSKNIMEEPIFSSTKYVEYHVTGQSIIDEDLEI